MLGEVEGGDTLPQTPRVLDAATMYASHDETAQRRKMPPRARDRIDDEMLALPVLDVSDDADQRHVGRNAELAPHRPSAAGREGGAIDAVEDGEEPARP